MSVLAYVNTEDGYHVCLTCHENLDASNPDDAQELDKLEPVTEESELRQDDGYPSSCDKCLGWVADVNEAYRTHPLADDITANTVACGDEALVHALSFARHLALEFETDTARLMEHMTVWGYLAYLALNGAWQETIAAVMQDTAKWAHLWDTRDILELREHEREYIATDGTIYCHRDTFGYLDVLEVDCSSCGRCVFNEMYESDDCGDTRCPDCVNIVW